MNIAPTQSTIQAALRAFLLDVLPGDPNAAPAVFVGAISGTTLTVSRVISGSIVAEASVLGAAPGTVIVGPGSAPNTYIVSPSQMLPNPTTMATGVTVIAGQQNRAAEPANPYFVVFTPIGFRRLATNVDGSADCKFAGSIAGTTMTVDDVDTGSIAVGATIFGTGVSVPTTVIQQLTGVSGGAGTYQVSPSQTVADGTLSAGQKSLTQTAEITVQIDFHSNNSLAGDWAQTVSTCLRDEFGTTFFAALAPPLNGVVPFYADDPEMRPFINAENAWEWRWTLDARFGIDQVVSTPLEYADSATVITKDVSALYPPA